MAPVRIRIMSDLHFEWQRDGGKQFVKRTFPKKDEFDILVVAGDLSDAKHLGESLALLSLSVAPRHIVYVPGNHEYWGADRGATRDVLIDLSGTHQNLHWLDNSDVTLHGVRFLGATLWFDEGKQYSTPISLYESGAAQWADYHQIKDLPKWVLRENAETKKYLLDAAKPGDVIITHHLPHRLSVATRFERSAANRFFYTDCSEVIALNEPRLWVHGHTHDSCDYKVEKTQVVCNPYGYEEIGAINWAWNPFFTVDVDD